MSNLFLYFHNRVGCDMKMFINTYVTLMRQYKKTADDMYDIVYSCFKDDITIRNPFQKGLITWDNMSCATDALLWVILCGMHEKLMISYLYWIPNNMIWKDDLIRIYENISLGRDTNTQQFIKNYADACGRYIDPGAVYSDLFEMFDISSPLYYQYRRNLSKHRLSHHLGTLHYKNKNHYYATILYDNTYYTYDGMTNERKASSVMPTHGDNDYVILHKVYEN